LSTPLRPRHKNMDFIKDTPKKPDDKKIPVEAAFKFFSALPELYRDLAMTQFYCAGRISEIAGIQISNLYLDQEYILIKNVVVWCNSSKVFEYLKPFPKNKESRRVHIHSALKENGDTRAQSWRNGVGLCDCDDGSQRFKACGPLLKDRW
jgi:integrase